MPSEFIVYDFELPDSTVWSFQVALNRPSPSAPVSETDPACPPPWTRLAFIAVRTARCRTSTLLPASGRHRSDRGEVLPLPFDDSHESDDAERRPHVRQGD